MSSSFELDLDHDGVADALGIDADGDGFAETVVRVDDAGETVLIADTDGNGIYDTTGVDATGDGTFETVAVDIDEDGTIDDVTTDDVSTDDVTTDAGGDGIADDPGQFDTTDPTDPGQFDTTDPTGGTGGEPTIMREEAFDTDGDGVDDGVIRQLDTDGDGQVDVVDILADQDGDGTLDGEVILIDDDHDGDADTTMIDADRSGGAETTIADLDGDDRAETVIHDDDEDGSPDVVELDLDGDGDIDEIVVPGETLTLDDAGHVTDIEHHGDIGDDDHPTDVSADPTDPAASTPAGEGGAPTDVSDEPVIDEDTEMSEDSTRWFEQSENGFCAPASVSFIVGEYTDSPIDEATFVERAIELGFLTETADGWSGLTTAQTAELLESFGVDASVETGTVDALDTYLDHGYNAIVAIDSSDIWEASASGGRADHAVVVSEIKDGYVYLLDPGTPDGNLEKVPVGVFEEAWSASGNEMVLTDNPDIDPDIDPEIEGVERYGASADTSPFDEDGWIARAAASPGTLFVPVVIAGAAVRAWTNRQH